MRALLIGALAATLVGCSCPSPPQPAMNGRKFNRQQKAFLRELRSATSFAFVVPSIGQERRAIYCLRCKDALLRASDMMEANAN